MLQEKQRVAGKRGGSSGGQCEQARRSSEKTARTRPDAGEPATATDALQLYILTIRQHALLSAEQETVLAQRVEHGKLAQRRLDDEEHDECDTLHRLIADGAAARNELVQANLRLVVAVARKYICQQLGLLDLVQEGNLGLLHAIDKFDWRKGNRLSTYATWWIREAIRRALVEQGSLIRLPIRLAEQLQRLRRTSYQLEQTLLRPATAEELSEALGISVLKVRRLQTISTTPISLEQPLGSDGTTLLCDTLADESDNSPLASVLDDLLHRDMHAALAQLSERDRGVLTLRFGLHDGRRRTLEEVGAALGVTRERARQLESDAMRRLRSSDVGRRLEDHLR